MSLFNYAGMSETAKRLIARFGKSGTIRRTTSSGDPFNPTQTTTDYACILVVLEFANKDIDGTLIRQTDRMVYVSTAGLTITPAVTDKIIINTAPLSIINVKPLQPGDTVLMYELQCRA